MADAEDQVMEEPIEVLSVEISPNGVEIEKDVNLRIVLKPRIIVSQAHFEVKFIYDYAATKHIVDFGTTETRDFTAKEEFTLDYKVPGVPKETLSRRMVNNVGLLQVILKDASTEVVSINFVTQLMKKGKDGEVLRTLFDPTQ